jgi:crossover junction endodeoxyribonuclease RusA
MRTDLEVSGHAHPEPDVWVLYFNWEKNPLPMNGSRGTHWAKRANLGRSIRTRAGYMARLAKIPALGRCKVELTWWVAINRTRDADNLAELEKRLFDGLVDAGVVADDKPELMTKDRGVIRKAVADSALLHPRRRIEPCLQPSAPMRTDRVRRRARTVPRAGG